MHASTRAFMPPPLRARCPDKAGSSNIATGDSSPRPGYPITQALTNGPTLTAEAECDDTSGDTTVGICEVAVPMRVRTQLSLAFAMMASGVVLLAMSSIIATSGALKAIRRTSLTHTQYSALTELSLATNAILKEIADGLLFGADDSETLEQMRECEARTTRAFALLQKANAEQSAYLDPSEFATQQADTDRIAVLGGLLEKLKLVDDRLVDAMQQGRISEAREIFETELESLYDGHIRTTLAASLDDKNALLAHNYADGLAQASLDRLIAAGCAIATLAVCLLIGGTLTHSLTHRVQNLVIGTEHYRNGELDYRVEEKGSDELTQLTQRFNLMAGDLQQQRAALERAHEQLLTAWEAGVAEVAGGVLHNIGNIVNNLNVSVGVLRESLNSCTAGKDLCTILEHAGDQAEDWVRFLSSDERGAALPAFLAAVSEQTNSEHTLLTEEITNLSSHIEHVRRILDIQNSYASASAVEESVSVVDLIEDAIQMCGSLGARGEIAVQKDYREVPRIAVDRHKTLQILINLLRNAKQSIRQQQPPEPLITIALRATDQGGVMITVSDNGFGIRPQDQKRVFDFGFTTKKHGQGIGLHNCGLAARVLGASLTVRSSGPGQGATFALDLPARPATASATEGAASCPPTAAS